MCIKNAVKSTHTHTYIKPNMYIKEHTLGQLLIFVLKKKSFLVRAPGIGEKTLNFSSISGKQLSSETTSKPCKCSAFGKLWCLKPARDHVTDAALATSARPLVCLCREAVGSSQPHERTRTPHLESQILSQSQKLSCAGPG